MSDRPPYSALETLRLANDKGEVGYAHGGDEKDWPAVQECLDCGWLRYGYDASTNSMGWRRAQARTVYFITPEGKREAAG